MPPRTPTPLPFTLGDVRCTVSHLEDMSYEGLQQWNVEATAVNFDEKTYDNVGSARIFRVSPDDCRRLGTTCWGVCDDESGDIAAVASVLFNTRTDRYREEVDTAAFAGLTIADDTLLLDSVWVNKEYRGHGLGPLVAGLGIRTLRGGAALAACIPSPTEKRNVDETVAKAALARTWETLGFAHFEDNVWVLDLGMRYLDDWFDRVTETP